MFINFDKFMKQLREIHVKTLEGGVKKIYGQQFSSQNGLKWRTIWSDHFFDTLTPSLRDWVV